MKLEAITPKLLETALKAWRRGEQPPSKLLDLELLDKYEGPDDEARLNALWDAVRTHIEDQLLTLRTRTKLPKSDIPPHSREALRAGIEADFGAQYALLEQWSALYHQYVEGSLPVRDLIELAMGPSQTEALFRANEKQFRRRLNGGLQLLRAEICKWETDARKARRRQLPGQEYRDYYDPSSMVDTITQMLFAPDGSRMLSIEGLGGIGKTALARQVAETTSKRSADTRVLWISARQEKFNTGLGPSLEPDRIAARSRADVTSALIDKLGFDHLAHLSPDDQVERLAGLLPTIRAVVVIDILETLDDIRLLVPDLQRMKGDTCFLLTSRESLARFDGIDVVPMPELPFPAVRRLLEGEMRRLGSETPLYEHDAARIYDIVGGIPLALKLIAAQLKVISNVDMVLAGISKPDGMEKQELMFEFIYRRTWTLLTEPARRLLLAIYDSVSPEGADLEWIKLMATSSSLPGESFMALMQQLYDYSLLEVIPGAAAHYTLHRLTITFLHSNITRSWTEQ